MDWVSSKENNFSYLVWRYVHEEVDIKYEFDCADDILVHVIVD